MGGRSCSCSPSRRPAQINDGAVWNASGALAGTTEPQLRTTQLNVAGRSFFKLVLAGADLPVEAPVVASSNGEQTAVFAIAVRREGRVIGAVTATARLRLLQSLVMPFKQRTQRKAANMSGTKIRLALAICVLIVMVVFAFRENRATTGSKRVQ